MEHVFPVPRERLWEVLLDSEQIASFIPGCEKMEETAPDRYAATLKIAVAAVKGTYTGIVEIRDREFPSSYTLFVEGSAAPGFVQGVAKMELSDTDEGHTRLSMKAEAQVGGLIASVGQRFLTGIARQMTKQMFRNVEKAVTQ